eukprot:TRINITY_DN18747_c0_g1_i1.p1 TRINITY_DN18747_c0_g1~~TRINITY_DN18747_c0_g1_i1.p1  ORF type:complete len:511 (+),score=101.89 TRINITY_DN18747_c0_g1_i1:64-1596(+)
MAALAQGSLGCGAGALLGGGPWLAEMELAGLPLLLPSVWSQGERVADDADWRERMTKVTELQRRCLGIGGRLWMADVLFRGNFTDADGQSVTEAGSPIVIPRSVCAPAGCSRAAMRTVLVPFYWSLVLAAVRAQRLSEPSFSEEEDILPTQSVRERARALLLMRGVSAFRLGAEIVVEELGAWASMQLAWVVIGFEGCGTTSLATHLQRHPDLELVFVKGRPYLGSKFFWGDWPHHHRLTEPAIRGLRGRLLPYRSEVELFNAWHSKPLPASPQALPRLRGIKSPKYVTDGVSLARLAEIPGLRAMIILEDPVLRIERAYLKNVAAWLADNATRELPSLASCIESPCGPLVYVQEGLWDPVRDPGHSQLAIMPEAFVASRHIAAAAAKFGEDRLLLIAREELRSDDRKLYGRLAAFLNVKAYAEDANVTEVVGNAMHHAPKPTWALRNDLRSLAAGAASSEFLRSHDATLAALRGLFRTELETLRGLFLRLSGSGPSRTALPGWLTQGTG